MTGDPHRGSLALSLGGALLLSSVLSAQEASKAADKTTEEPAGSRGEWQMPVNYSAALGAQVRTEFHAANYANHAMFVGSNPDSHSIARLRMRTWVGFYEKDRRDHGAYFQIQIGGIDFGKDGEFSKTKSLSGDEVGVTLRRGYLWYKPQESDLLRAGVVDWHDRFGYRADFADTQWSIDAYDSAGAALASSVWDFQVAGVDYAGLLGEGSHYRAGIYALQAGDKTVTGGGSTTLYALDFDQDLGKHLIGASLYYLDDRGSYSYGTFGGPKAVYENSRDLWLGIRAALDLDTWKPVAFLIYNSGRTDGPDWKHAGFATGLATTYESGKQLFHAQLRYSTGNDGSDATDSGEFRTIAQSEQDNFGAQSYWSDVAITSPRGPADVSNLGVGLQNRGLGLLTLQGSVRHQLRDNLHGYFGLAWLRSAEDNPANGSSDMGVEAMAELQWRMAKALTLDVGAGYMFTGSFYKASTTAPSPSDLYTVYLRLQLEF